MICYVIYNMKQEKEEATQLQYYVSEEGCHVSKHQMSKTVAEIIKGYVDTIQRPRFTKKRKSPRLIAFAKI